MKYKFGYSGKKDLVLRKNRGIGFEEVIVAINGLGVLDDIDHFNKKKYPNQRIFIVNLNDKVYAVPYVKDKVRDLIFLKTIYPSRKLKKEYVEKNKKIK